MAETDAGRFYKIGGKIIHESKLTAAQKKKIADKQAAQSDSAQDQTQPKETEQ